MSRLTRRFYHFDWLMLLALILLMTAGVIAVYTASTVKVGNEIITGNDYLKQIIWIGISLVSILIIIQIPYQVFDILIIPSYFIIIIGLIVVLFMPEIKGSTRWIVLGPLQIQPSEFAKVTTILMLAKSLGKPYLSEFQIISRALIIGLPPVILLSFQPDLGTTIVFWMIIFSVLLLSDLPKFYLIIFISPFLAILASFYLPAFIIFILLLSFVLFKFNLSTIVIGFVSVVNIFIYFLTPILWNSLKEYQRSRVLSFLDPTRDPLGSGYQAIQSRIAIGSGLFQGKGFLEGTQKNLNFLPERHTDFIFSVIAEEFGFLGGMLILLLFFFLISRIINSLKTITNQEQRLFVIGTAGFITTQAVVNIAINLGIFPTTGLPLPFISYGGSSLLANSIAIAIILKYLTEKSFL